MDLFKKGICPECNHEVEVYTGRDAMICDVCGCAFSVKKAISKYAMAHKDEFARDTAESVMNKGRQAAENVTGFAFGVVDSYKERKAEKERREREQREREIELQRIRAEEASKRHTENVANFEAWVGENKKVVISVVVAIFLLFLGTLYAFTHEDPNDTRLKVPYSSGQLCSMGYEEARQNLEDAGFTNITMNPKYDIVLGIFASEGEVESVKFGGDTSFSAGTRFPADVAITITYHLDTSANPDLAYLEDETEEKVKECKYDMAITWQSLHDRDIYMLDFDDGEAVLFFKKGKSIHTGECKRIDDRLIYIDISHPFYLLIDEKGEFAHESDAEGSDFWSGLSYKIEDPLEYIDKLQELQENQNN